MREKHAKSRHWVVHVGRTLELVDHGFALGQVQLGLRDKNDRSPTTLFGDLSSSWLTITK